MTQSLVRGSQHIFAYVTQEVQVTTQHGDLLLESFDQLGGRRDHRTTEIAHHGVGLAKGSYDLAQVWQDQFSSFSRYFPGPQNPPTFPGIGDKACASAVFAGGVDVKRVAAVARQGLTDCHGIFAVESG